MLERKITKELLEWKNEKNKPCLLIKGARNVGKTYIISEFAKDNYQSLIYINFETMPKYKEIFNGNLDIDTLIMKLELYFPNTEIIPNNTILLLDEIEFCPNARVALKSFALDGRIDVVASGSLLGLHYKEVSSYPVGYERYINMYPLDFEEFLWGLGIKKEIIDNLRKSFMNKKPVVEYINKQFSDYFKLYMIVGGMPKIVSDYIESSSMSITLKNQKSIIDNYIYDIEKYADKSDKSKIINTFYSIPVQLAKNNKKFSYVSILENEKDVGERKYASSLDWLKDAGIVSMCYNLENPEAPLISNVRLNCFKLYMNDTGLLTSMYENSVQNEIINNNYYINSGAIVENVCAGEIKRKYGCLMYFEKKSKLEIDFILNIDGIVTAIEVKSGNNKQAKSLNSIIENYKSVKRYIKLEYDTNIYIDEKGIEHYPLYMIMFI